MLIHRMVVLRRVDNTQVKLDGRIMINDKMSWSPCIEIRRKNESLRGTFHYIDVMRLIDLLSSNLSAIFFIIE